MKVALVIGGADCVTEDILIAKNLFEPDSVYACNDIGAYVERLDVWATLHPEKLELWEAERKKRGFRRNYEVVAPPPGELGEHGGKGKIDRRVSYRWKDMNSSASSGIYAAKVALDDGYKVVLAGVPMERMAGHFIRNREWIQRDAFTVGLEAAKPFMLGKVKSVSGLTRKIFGEPTLEWLTSDPMSLGKVGTRLEAQHLEDVSIGRHRSAGAEHA